jgi:L-fuconolactonase
LIVDAHQHFWDLDRVDYPWLVPAHGPIYRTFQPPELEPQLRAAGIDRTVLVQAANSFEDTDAMLEQAGRYEWIGAVVGWVPLDVPAATSRALDEKYLRDPHFRGVRHLNHEEADPDWLVRPAVIDSLRVLQAHGLVFEAVSVWPLHLRHVPTLARACPDLTIVVDHLAKPPIKGGDLTAWASDLRNAAACPNVHAKVSGLNTAADWETWTAEDLVPAIGTAVEAFGTDRLMFGSDWPVALLAGDYDRVWRATCRALSLLSLSDAEQAGILGDNAAALYRLEEDA